MVFMNRLSLLVAVLICLPPTSLVSQTVQLRPLQQIRIDDGQHRQLTGLHALSVSNQNQFYLVDTALNRVLRTDSAGAFLSEIGGFGWGSQQFDHPLDIWAENSLDVFVVDYNNNRVQRFDRNLNYLSSLTNDENLEPRLQFGFPESVTLSRFGELLIAENENHRILRIDTQGRPTQSFGDYDWGMGNLEKPVSVCMAEDDEILVADAARRAVVRFDYYGNFLQEISDPKLMLPGGIATKPGVVFVVDNLSQRVFVFDRTGEPVVNFAISTPTQDAGRKDGLLDVAVAGDRLYVLDGSSGVVHCFQIITILH